MSYLEQSMKDIEREVNGFYDMAGHRNQGGGSMFGGTRTGGMNASNLLEGNGNQYAEAYSHYKSWPYVAIRAISHRVAGQRIYMARRAAGSAAEQGPRNG